MMPENACTDEPKSTDFAYDQLNFGATAEVPEIKFLPKTIFNQ